MFSEVSNMLNAFRQSLGIAGCLRIIKCKLRPLVFLKRLPVLYNALFNVNIYEPVYEISNNMTCATSKASDQPAHTCRLFRAYASRLSII